MTGEPLRFSVVIASWHRQGWLRRSLLAVSQLDYPEFEVIVVADADSLASIDVTYLKTVLFDKANLSAARNAGIRVAGGDVIAFIDDDTVPEPMWLAHLAAAFRSAGAAAAKGYVRGRNGISFQSRVASVDAEAETHDEPNRRDTPFFPDLRPGRALKLIGTNMAIRREAFDQIGGFDETYRYFLEDSDVSFRLMQAGLRSVAVPHAEVHHAFAPSARRTALRAPTDLFDIGRSTAVYLRRHLGRAEEEIWLRIHKRERARLLRHMTRGTCEPRDVRRLLKTLEDGWKDGTTALLQPVQKVLERREFRRFPNLQKGHVVLATNFVSQRKRMTRQAEQLVREGNRVSQFSFSLTPVRHHVRYTPSGIWLQTGGQFGRSDRNGPWFRWCRFTVRRTDEIQRVANARGIGDDR